MVKVSVILTAFNEEKYISKTIESILNQTLEDLEMILQKDLAGPLVVEVVVESENIPLPK